MANGRSPSNIEDGVVRPGVRVGLKRELAFALKEQACLQPTLGRTRSGNSRVPIVAPRASKRSRVSAQDPKVEAVFASPTVVFSAHCDLVGEFARDAVEDQHEAAVEIVLPLEEGSALGTVEARVGGDESMVDDPLPPEHQPTYCKGECNMNSSHLAEPVESETPVSMVDDPLPNMYPIDGKGEGSADSSHWIEPVGSEPRGKADCTVDSPTHLEDLTQSEDSAPIMADGMLKLNVEFSENECFEDLVVVDGNDEFEADSSRTLNQVHGTGSSMVDASEEATIITAFTASAMVEDRYPVEIRQDGKRMAKGSSKKPFVKRFTRSSLKIPAMEHEELNAGSPVAMNDEETSHKHSDSQPGIPLRKLTGSTAAAISESCSGDITSTSSSSSAEDAKGLSNPVEYSPILKPKKKLELKMSKKIIPTKLPSNVRELLSTGLLEGLPVRYISSKNNLKGVIKGNGILCFCSSCNGSIIVSAYVFEQHANSLKKHPANFIYLANGRSLHDVIKACSLAPLDMLGSAIQNAIASVSSATNTFTCEKCQGSFLIAHSQKLSLLCDSCLVSQKPPKTPIQIHGNSKILRQSKTGSAKGPIDSSSKNLSNKRNSIGRITRRDLSLHKLVFTNDILPEGTEVGYYICGKRLLEGYIKESGIYCQCCNSVVSPSEFEGHAGQASRRKPYNNIYTSNGVSLHELSVSLAKDRKGLPSESDDLCSICADGGNLLLCDLCPRAFHKECIGLSDVPSGDWYCQYCLNLQQREKCLASNKNAIAAGRIAGVDPIEQIFERCIRTVTTTQTDDSSCILCRCHDFSKAGFNDRTVMICDQCEREYHVGCLRDHKLADLKELPSGEWFCCADCSRIRSTLKEFLHHGAELLPPSHADIIKKKREYISLNNEADVAISWRLLCGRNLDEGSKLMLSRAVAIFHESFDPIVDSTTGRDLIPSIVYGRTMRGQDFGGMYCPVLLVGSYVVSVGILRVLGSEVAELPLVATSREHQGQGYFQTLFQCIERFLTSVGVKHLVLPAADETESLWIKKFSFTKISSDQLDIYLKGAHATSFQGTSMLHKPIPTSQVEHQVGGNMLPILYCDVS